ncbi:MAG: twin-arginine translocase TatA/TatE family subunit [Planctomycetaceae bacterium]
MLGVIGMPGPLELVIIAGIILLLFGKRLPEVMGSLGRSIVEFKKGASDENDRNSDDASQGKVTES